MQKIFKSRIIYFLKIIITGVILYLIFKKIDLSEVIHNFFRMKITVVTVILITAILKIYLHYKNWGKYLQLNPDYLSDKRETFKSLMIGEALRFLIPGGYGVVGKMYFVNNKKNATLISVGIEKFMQIWTSLLFASFAAIFYFNQISLIVKLLGFSLILVSPFLISTFSILIKRIDFKSYIKGYNRSIIPIVLRQICYMFLTLIQYYVLLRNFNDISLFSVLISVPLILSANLIPFSYAGLGFKETFAIEILSRYNISAEIAVTATLSIFFISTILPALIGLYYIIRSKPKFRSD